MLSPLERGAIRLGDGSPRPLPTAKERPPLRPGLRAQALGFIEAMRDFGFLPAPASDFCDHARTMDLVERIEQLA
jgi:hypothetical protein